MKPTKEELNSLYHNKQLTTIEIGKIYGVSTSTINNWMKEYGMVTQLQAERDRIGKIKPSKKELEKAYIEEKRSMREIGVSYGVTGDTVRRWMVEYDIRRRNHFEVAHFEEKIPTKEDLEKLLNKKSMLQMAKIYGVANSTVINWIDHYQINRKKGIKKGLWKDEKFTLEQARLFLEQHPEYSELPCSEILAREGYSNLVRPIKKYHGGFPAFREKLRVYLGRDKSSLLEQYAGGDK